MRSPAPLLLALSCAACQMTEVGTPGIEANAQFASAYVFRGAPQNTEGVLQTAVANTLPLGAGEAVAFTTWANWDLTNDAGDGALPGGLGGQVSELDLTANFTKDYERFSIAYGVIAYQYPNLVGLSTHEVFASIAAPWRGLTPAVTVFADFDEVQGFYVEGSLGSGRELDERTTLDWGVSLGITDAEHSRAYYGVAERGLADVRVEASVSRRMNEHTTASLSAHASSLLGGKLTDAVEASGGEARNLWVGLGIGWSF